MIEFVQEQIGLRFVGRAGAVGSASDFGPRGPWFNPRTVRRLVCISGVNNIS